MDSARKPIPISTVTAPLMIPAFDSTLESLRMASDFGLTEPWAAVALSLAEEIDRLRCQMEGGE